MYQKIIAKKWSEILLLIATKNTNFLTCYIFDYILLAYKKGLKFFNNEL